MAVLVNMETTPVQLHATLFPSGDPAGRGISSYLTDAEHHELDHVRVIAGIRSDAGVDTRHELDHAHRTALDPPTQHDLLRFLPAIPPTLVAELGSSGGWLIARLVSETQETEPETQPWDAPAAVTLEDVVQARFATALHRMSHPGAGVLLTSLLLAAGVGPVLPIELAARILRTEHPSTLARDMIVELGALVSRGKPGSPEETVGIAHSEFQRVLETAVARHTEKLLTQAGAETRLISAANETFLQAAHAVILSALSELESAGEVTPNIATYAEEIETAVSGGGCQCVVGPVLGTPDGSCPSEFRRRWLAPPIRPVCG